MCGTEEEGFASTAGPNGTVCVTVGGTFIPASQPHELAGIESHPVTAGTQDIVTAHCGAGSLGQGAQGTTR